MTKDEKSKIYLHTILIFIFGIILGLVSKILDEILSNLLPSFLEVFDLGNFFSRMGVWLFLAVLISIYSCSPRKSAINVFLFFTGMVSSYYLYTVLVAGFYPRDYMMIWITLTMVSPFLAFIVWHAKGENPLAIILSSLILMIMSRQAFAIGFWYFDILNLLELFLLVATVLILYQSPKQILKVSVIGFSLYLLTSQMSFFWGLL